MSEVSAHRAKTHGRVLAEVIEPVGLKFQNEYREVMVIMPKLSSESGERINAKLHRPAGTFCWMINSDIYSRSATRRGISVA